jgi:hypothetical protein
MMIPNKKESDPYQRINESDLIAIAFLYASPKSDGSREVKMMNKLKGYLTFINFLKIIKSAHLIIALMVSLLLYLSALDKLVASTIKPEQIGININLPAASKPTSDKITVSLIGQSILHRPGGPGDKILGKNLFYYLKEWGNGQIEEDHWTRSGVGLESHVRFTETSSLIKKGNSYFVMCEGTKFIWHNHFIGTQAATRKLGNQARSAGSVPVIYIPYAHGIPNPSDPPKDRHEPWFKTEEVMRIYMTLASNLDMAFIPIADAIGEAAKKFGHQKIYEDPKHINSDGQFLAGCVTWATLTQISPRQINYRGDTEGLKLPHTELIQICRQTIEKYPQKPKLFNYKVYSSN